MKLVGYVRVSRIGGRSGDGYISPSVQREAIEAYAAELGGRIVHFADDQDFGGGSVDRPAFQDALDRIDAGEFDGIVVMKIDRFARSVADGVGIVRRLSDEDKVFASCHERIDLRTPEGRFMATMFFANAELFLDQIKASWQVAKARAIARGVHIGAAPYGYFAVKSQPLRVDPVTGPVVSEVFRRAATEGPSALARYVESRTGRAHRPNVIRRWLRNRIYLGEIRYGELVNTEAHPPLTDEATWQAAQTESGVRYTAPEAFLLSGLVRCANCRYAMGGNTRGGFNRDTPIYRCGRRCGEPSVITAAKVESIVQAAVRGALADLRLEAVEEDADLVALERAAVDAEAELAAFASDLGARRVLGDVGWRDALEARAAARDEAQARLADARALAAASAVELDDLSRHDLRDLLGGMIRAVFVRRGRGDDRVKIMWADSDVALPARDAEPLGPFEW